MAFWPGGLTVFIGVWGRLESFGVPGGRRACAGLAGRLDPGWVIWWGGGCRVLRSGARGQLESEEGEVTLKPASRPSTCEEKGDWSETTSAGLKAGVEVGGRASGWSPLALVSATLKGCRWRREVRRGTRFLLDPFLRVAVTVTAD